MTCGLVDTDCKDTDVSECIYLYLSMSDEGRDMNECSTCMGASVCFMNHVYCMFPCRICKGCQLKSLRGTIMHNIYIFTSAGMINQLKEQHKIIDKWFIKTRSAGHKWKYTKGSLCCQLFYVTFHLFQAVVRIIDSLLKDKQTLKWNLNRQLKFRSPRNIFGA